MVEGLGYVNAILILNAAAWSGRGRSSTSLQYNHHSEPRRKGGRTPEIHPSPGVVAGCLGSAV